MGVMEKIGTYLHTHMNILGSGWYPGCHCYPFRNEMSTYVGKYVFTHRV
jgi:hypothetical protein